MHYVRTGRYDSPLPPLRADAARARRETHPDDTDAWFAGWAQRFASERHTSLNRPLHSGNWQLTPGLPRHWDIAANWARLPHHDPPIGHITWFGHGDPEEDARDILPLRPLSAPDAARVQAYRWTAMTARRPHSPRTADPPSWPSPVNHRTGGPRATPSR
ncbi:hypothetical protein [Streptomyces inhibens]|uniref:hypothetical protein n=1 Tax=Streptomyces inhibens TaxID=2293571 RepID=UPI001EE6E8C9|nr:hypothetical protein [Streptomyces inhibens]UKY53630.1 hypothetical protein KI385_35720 [Streptomyces inhibens]